MPKVSVSTFIGDGLVGPKESPEFIEGVSDGQIVDIQLQGKVRYPAFGGITSGD